MAIKDITLGQYFPAESPIHRLDARTKILGTLLYLISLFFVGNFAGFVFAFACFMVVEKLSTVPFGYMTRGLKPIFILIIFTVLINLFSTPGTAVLTLWKLTITKEGIYRASFMAIRLILLILGSSLLTLATKPITLTDGIESLLSPFKKFGLPAHELAMMMSIALRFIPTLMDETDKIMKAQTARGADFESGNIIQRAKALVPLLIPLFISSFRIAADLAMAMEARCYRGGEGRSRMNKAVYGKGDYTAALFLCIYFAAALVIRKLPLF